MLSYLTSGGLQHQIAASIDLHLVSRIEPESNLADTPAWRHDEVVFELPLIPVVNHVDARVNTLVTHFATRRHARSPLPGIVAKEIIHLRWQPLQLERGRCDIRAHQRDPHTDCVPLADPGPFRRTPITSRVHWIRPPSACRLPRFLERQRHFCR